MPISVERLKHPGDRIVVDSRRTAARRREGTVLEVGGGESRPRYLVRWDDGQEGYLYPRPLESGTPETGRRASPTGVPRSKAAALRRRRLTARPGDRLVVSGHHQGEPERDAEILEVRGDGGGPPFVVRWEDTGSVAILYPGSDAHVQRFRARS